MEIWRSFSLKTSHSHMGQLREGQKADLVNCLKAVATPEIEQPTLDAIILNGAVIVQVLPPGTVSTLKGTAKQCLVPTLKDSSSL